VEILKDQQVANSSIADRMSATPAARGRVRSVAQWIVTGFGVYLTLSYLVLPSFWRHYEHLPEMKSMPKVTRAPNGLPGDPLNVALVGSEVEIQRAIAAAGWHPADPITFRSSLAIAEGVVLHRPDPDAPVSTLFLFGRRQDLAFERDVGGSPRERNHVRLWRTDLVADGDRPVWVGGATFDRSVGLSHTTGQITHHIAPDIDAERDTLMRDFEAVSRLKALYFVTGVGPTVSGRSGDGDRYFTDGELAVGVLSREGMAADRPVEKLPSPTPVLIKNQFWSWIRPAL
jgi:hypothetical protein